MAVYEKEGCVVRREESDPVIWVCFDPRVSHIADSDAGDYYQQLSKVAYCTRLYSHGKYELNASRINSGMIQVINNLAIEDDYPVETVIDDVVRIVSLARV